MGTSDPSFNVYYNVEVFNSTQYMHIAQVCKMDYQQI